jgi:hypothetical protein
VRRFIPLQTYSGVHPFDYLKDKKYERSLAKLRHEEWKRKHSYSLWQKEKNVLSVFSEAMFMQKVNYIHLNPVRAGLVQRAIDYRGQAQEYGSDVRRMMSHSELTSNE